MNQNLNLDLPKLYQEKRKSRVFWMLFIMNMKRLLNFLIVSTTYLGVGLFFLFNNLNFLFLSLIGIIYMLSTKYNIPILSYISRSFNYSFAKFAVFKQTKSNPIQMLPLMIYLEKSPEPKKIYLRKGPKALAKHLTEYSKNQNGSLMDIFDNLNKVRNDVNNLQNTGTSDEVTKDVVEKNLQQFLGNGSQDEKNIEKIKSLSSMIVNMERLQRELNEKKESGMSEEEIKNFHKQKANEILSQLIPRNKKDGEE